MDKPQSNKIPNANELVKPGESSVQQPKVVSNVPQQPSPKTADRFLAATDQAQAKGVAKVTLMADGTLRTDDGVLVKPSDWKHKNTWLGRWYRKLHRIYLRITLRWPRWVPRAILAGVIALILVNGVVLGVYINNRKVAEQRGPALPTVGIVPADGSKYYVSDANWQYAGASANWSVEEVKGADGRRYSLADGTCQVQAVRTNVDRTGATLETISQTTVQKYAINPASAKAQVSLPTITVRAVAGEQRYEFVRRRYSYATGANTAQVSEVSVRTLGNRSFAIVQTCQQDAWDQTQAARDALVGNLAIAAR